MRDSIEPAPGIFDPMKPKEISNEKLRRFTLLVGGAFAVVGTWPMLFRNSAPRLWAFALAGLLILAGIARPQVVLPVYKGWMATGRVLAWINTRLILGILFYVVFTPAGLIRRTFGGDALNRKFKPNADTYRVLRPSRPGTHMERQF